MILQFYLHFENKNNDSSMEPIAFNGSGHRFENDCTSCPFYFIKKSTICLICFWAFIWGLLSLTDSELSCERDREMWRRRSKDIHTYGLGGGGGLILIESICNYFNYVNFNLNTKWHYYITQNFYNNLVDPAMDSWHHYHQPVVSPYAPIPAPGPVILL